MSIEVGFQRFQKLGADRLRAPLGRPLGLPLWPGWNGLKFLSFFSVLSASCFFFELRMVSPLDWRSRFVLT
jgi:hypothetical protein